MSAAGVGRLVVFKLDAQRFALPLEQVESATRAVAITPLPQAPTVVSGMVDVRGSVIPVINIRRRLQLPARAVGLDDQLLITRTAKRRYAAVVDAVLDVIDYAASDYVATATVVPGMEYLQGVLRLPDGIVLIHDLEQFLSLEEDQALSEALAHG